MANAKRIGILGGAFNPIHLGHLILAEQAKEQLGLEGVVFVPSCLPPHKKRKTLASAHDRYQMVELAVKDNPCFKVSDIELKRDGVSYSIDTVRQLRKRFSKARLYFIVGSDFLEQFSVWKNIKNLSRLCKFVIAERPKYSVKKLPESMQSIRMRPLEISSTDIRRRIRNKKSIRYLVPEKVRKYILKRKLYCVRMKKHSKGGV